MNGECAVHASELVHGHLPLESLPIRFPAVYIHGRACVAGCDAGKRRVPRAACVGYAAGLAGERFYTQTAGIGPQPGAIDVVLAIILERIVEIRIEGWPPERVVAYLLAEPPKCGCPRTTGLAQRLVQLRVVQVGLLAGANYQRPYLRDAAAKIVDVGVGRERSRES